MRRFRFVWLLIGCWFAGAVPLAAADLPLKTPPEMRAPPAKAPPAAEPPVKLPVMPPAKTEMPSDDDFAQLPANCVTASDGCRTFRRADDGKFDPLNNIGIACQPKKPVCTATK